MAESVIIRDAKPADAEGIAATHISCWQEAYAGQLPQDFVEGLSSTFERRREFWRGIAAEPGPQEALLVVDEDGVVVGFAHVCPSRDADARGTTGEVTAIYLRKAFWGRGIGRRLFAEAVERLRGFAFDTAILWVLDSNQRTRRFYEVAGWEHDGGEKDDPLGELVVREVRYRTDL